MNLKAFTWNMQRRVSFLPNRQSNKTVAAAVKRALLYLCDNHDIGFITEPGKDIRTWVNGHDAGSPLPGHWVASGKSDNQSDASACRPLVYAKNDILKPFDIDFRSGGQSAVRYPAGATTSIREKLLFVSMHATSGGGQSNVQAFLDWLDDRAASSRAKFDAWLIGGDFNAIGGTWSPLTMPKEPTQQSGGTLDGFFANSVDSSSTRIDIGKVTAVKGFTLCRFAPPGAEIGCFFDDKKVSDHIPVTTEISISEFEEFEELKSPKKRRKLAEGE